MRDIRQNRYLSNKNNTYGYYTCHGYTSYYAKGSRRYNKINENFGITCGYFYEDELYKNNLFKDLLFDYMLIKGAYNIIKYKFAL